MFCLADENNGRRYDDHEYMNAAAAHAAFVMTVSAARMYWLLHHTQHARDINIHKCHRLPEKNRLGLCRFSARWNTLLLFSVRFSVSTKQPLKFYWKLITKSELLTVFRAISIQNTELAK